MAQFSDSHFGYDKAVVANPIRMTEIPPEYRLAPPILGADTAAMLSRRLGLDEAELGALR